MELILINITFHPESDDPSFVAASAEYQAIWNSSGHSFVRALEAKTGLALPDISLNALVFEGTSRAYPLILRASYSSDIKASTLVHELGHRLLTANGLRPEFGQDFHIYSHKLLNLFLYDTYLELFGEEKATQAVAYESNLRPSYRECWQWTLELSEVERAARFDSIKRHGDDWLPYLDGRT